MKNVPFADCKLEVGGSRAQLESKASLREGEVSKIRVRIVVRAGGVLLPIYNRQYNLQRNFVGNKRSKRNRDRTLHIKHVLFFSSVLRF